MYICQICKKVPATIHLTDIHNNVKKEIHMCEACAAEKGFNIHGTASLPQLLGLAAKKNTPSPVQSAQLKVKAMEHDLVCPQCGMTWSQFGDRGRLGCPHDYLAFESKLRPLIANQIAGSNRNEGPFHTGKHPGPTRAEDAVRQQLRSLNKKLRAAVAEENYETAAILKAELDKLRQTISGLDTPDE